MFVADTKNRRIQKFLLLTNSCGKYASALLHDIKRRFSSILSLLPTFRSSVRDINLLRVKYGTHIYQPNLLSRTSSKIDIIESIEILTVFVFDFPI